MTHREAIQFLEPAVAAGPFTWADLGAGSGVFTRAVATLLGPRGKIIAVDRSTEVLEISAPTGGAKIHLQQADFTRKMELPPLDGILMANALHFIRKQTGLLQGLTQQLNPGAAFLLVEYDNDWPNPWVPYPVSFQKFGELAEKAGLSQPEELHRRPSRYGQGMLYNAVCRKKN